MLGVMIVFASCFIVGWMTFEAPDCLRVPAPEGGGYIDVVPEHKSWFDVSRYGAYALPALGIFLVITGAVQAARADTRTRNLAAAAIAVGLVTAGLAFIITVYGFPTSFEFIDPENSNSIRHMLGGQTREQGLMQAVAGFTGFAGLAVVVCRVIQVLKAGNTKV